MSLNPYEAQMIAQERIKDALREAQRMRLIRGARNHTGSRRWRRSAKLVRTSLAGILTGIRLTEPRRSPSPAPDPTCTCAVLEA